MIKSFELHNPNIIVPNDLTKWVIRFELSKLTMILKNMDLETIIFTLMKKFPDIFIVYSAENDDVIVIRCYLSNLIFKKLNKITLDTISNFKNVITNTVIRGVHGVNAANVVKKNKSYVSDDGSIQSKLVYAIQTNGTNFDAIMENPFLDTQLCQTDSIKEVEKIFGIEAARHKLRSELEKLMPGISQAHYSIYADEMCSTGIITGISKSGLEKREAHNVLLRTSYSFMNQVMRSAAVNSRKGKIYGMSAPLMIGRAPYVGSTYNQIAIDHDFVEKNTKTISNVIDDL
jgi:hypothetical protein